MVEPRSIELLTLLNQVNNVANTYKKNAGLTVNALSILFYLQHNENVRQRDIADYLNISKATIGVELRILEKRGFISRVQGERDSREIIVNITNAGLVQYSLVLRDLNNQLKDFDVEDLINQLEDLFMILGGIGRRE